MEEYKRVVAATKSGTEQRPGVLPDTYPVREGFTDEVMPRANLLRYTADLLDREGVELATGLYSARRVLPTLADGSSIDLSSATLADSSSI